MVSVYQDSYDGATDQPDRDDIPPSKAKEDAFDKRVLINKTRPEPCDHELTLYQLNSDKESIIYNTPANGCERPFTVLPIKQSNMILLVVDTLCPIAEQSVPITTQPFDITYNTSLMCHKYFSDMPRKRPISCINKHHNVSTYALINCGTYLNDVNFYYRRVQ